MDETNVKIKYINKFGSYMNLSDITNMPTNSPAPGTLNIINNNTEKLSPRAGSDYFGAQGTQGTQTDPYWTLAHRIHSKYDDFVNKKGIKIPIRVWYDGTDNVGDVMEAWLPDYTSLGVATNVYSWKRITALSPSSPILSTHKWYFAEWYDPATTVLQTELIFTYGDTKIGNFSGGFAPITVVGVNTITSTGIWDSFGFLWAPEGANKISINGIEYTVTGGYGTNTLTVSTPVTGVVAGDIAFQLPYFNDTLGGKTTYDVCSIINNQVYYIDWKQRNVYVSWNRNQVQHLNQDIYIGTSNLDDAKFTGTYTGSTTDTYEVMIDGVNPGIPAINQQSFIQGTPYSLNDATYGTSGYTGVAGVLNNYEVITVANYTLHAPSIIGTFTPGETVTNGTGATAMYFAEACQGVGCLFTIHGVRLLTGQFNIGDTVTGLSSGTSIVLDDVYYGDWVQCFKNGVGQILSSLFLSQYTAPLEEFGLSFTLVDGLTITFTNTYGHGIGDSWLLSIRKVIAASPDTFKWFLNGTLQTSGVSITGAAQLLSQGVSVTFDNTTGHDVGDKWTVKAFPTIIRGWSNFYYSTERFPGEGFTLQLDSNGWTMKPQESVMLINDAAGRFYDVVLTLSSNLTTETLVVKRLKSETQNKILYPYLFNYIKNQLATVSQEKTFDLLGRQKFLELQQMKTLSDAVRIDFESSNWEDADVLYFKRKIYFNLPKENLIFIYDDYLKIWQPPQQFAKRISGLSIIDGKLIGHSYEQNESYELFVGTSDLGNWGIKVKLVLPYDSAGSRMIKKAMSAIGFEGYIDGAPTINYTINVEVGGCKGQKTGVIFPYLCLPADRASLGKSGLGYHGLGNNPVTVAPHFFYIKTFDNIEFYQRNIELTCEDLDQRWSLISLGTDIRKSNINNSDITDPN